MNNPTDLLTKINILVVDDMDAIRSMIKACLRELGATRVMATYNGEEAWKLLQKHHIDMVICDWDMPKITGVELLKLVRSHETTQHIPFLMLTASIDKTRVIEAIQSGVSDYLSKPFQPKELEFRVIKLLRKVVIPPKTNTSQKRAK